jgi:hypothetical protein
MVIRHTRVATSSFGTKIVEHIKMKVGVVLALLALCSAVPLDSAAETDALQFLSGFLSGLRLDAKAPSACYNDTLALKDDVRDIIWDLERLFKGDEMGLMALLSDVKGI